MAACAELSYETITPAVRDTLAADVLAHFGVTVTGDTGAATKSGFTVRWAYDATAQTLKLQCTDSPFIVPCFVINGQIDFTVQAAIKACMAPLPGDA